MGAVFAIAWTRLDHRTGPGQLAAAGFRRIALTPRAEATSIDAVPDAERLALLVGTEGPGLSDRWLADADALARIPMHAGIDSLNVSAAAAIALHRFGRPAGEG